MTNFQTERLFGYRRDDLLGLGIESLVSGLFRRGQRLPLGRSLLDSIAWPMGVPIELYGRRKDGRDFPVEITLSPLDTEEGLLVTRTIRDITDRKRLEARYRNLVEGIPAVTFMATLDEGDNELYVSPQIERAATQRASGLAVLRWADFFLAMGGSVGWAALGPGEFQVGKERCTHMPGVKRTISARF